MLTEVDRGRCVWWYIGGVIGSLKSNQAADLQAYPDTFHDQYYYNSINAII